MKNIHGRILRAVGLGAAFAFSISPAVAQSDAACDDSTCARRLLSLSSSVVSKSVVSSSSSRGGGGCVNRSENMTLECEAPNIGNRVLSRTFQCNASGRDGTWSDWKEKTYNCTRPELPGDVDGNGGWDCNDLYTVQASYGKVPGDPGFNSRADVVPDGVIDNQ